MHAKKGTEVINLPRPLPVVEVFLWGVLGKKGTEVINLPRPALVVGVFLWGVPSPVD